MPRKATRVNDTELKAVSSVMDGQIRLGGHHSPGGKDERVELVVGHSKQ